MSSCLIGRADQAGCDRATGISFLATSRKIRVKDESMNRLFALLACLALTLSFATASVAHAMEPIGCIDGVSPSAAESPDGDDGGQASGDADRAYPHHHGGCHGHHVAAAFAASEIAPAMAQRTARLRWTSSPHGAAPARAELRPPIA